MKRPDARRAPDGAGGLKVRLCVRDALARIMRAREASRARISTGRRHSQPGRGRHAGRDERATSSSRRVSASLQGARQHRRGKILRSSRHRRIDVSGPSPSRDRASRRGRGPLNGSDLGAVRDGGFARRTRAGDGSWRFPRAGSLRDADIRHPGSRPRSRCAARTQRAAARFRSGGGDGATGGVGSWQWASWTRAGTR